MLYEMYTVQPGNDKNAGKDDFMVTSKPVPAAGESLEVLAPTQQENMCKFA
ncbi:hypothetical protein D3C78_1984430 [compost metagenome]